MTDTQNQGKEHTTTYFVNGEEQSTTEKSLTVSIILERAGFSPAAEYELEDDANHKVYSDPTTAVHLHEKQRLTATYTGTTPTS
jgi:uncharacterized protein YabE (DUF348 family)